MEGLKMNKYILTYTKDSTAWDAVNSLLVEAYSRDDVEENLVDLLMQAGEELHDAQAVEDDTLYFIKNADVDATVQY